MSMDIMPFEYNALQTEYLYSASSVSKYVGWNE